MANFELPAIPLMLISASPVKKATGETRAKSR
jgi:hypothetical protein